MAISYGFSPLSDPPEHEGGKTVEGVFPIPETEGEPVFPAILEGIKTDADTMESFNKWVAWARKEIKELGDARDASNTYIADLTHREVMQQNKVYELEKKIKEQDEVIRGLEAWMKLRQGKSIEIMQPGTRVEILGGISSEHGQERKLFGEIAEVALGRNGGQPSYLVTWWTQGNRTQCYLSPHEISEVDTEALPIPSAYASPLFPNTARPMPTPTKWTHPTDPSQE